MPSWPNWVKGLAEVGISRDSKILVSENEVLAADGSFRITKNGIYKKHPFSHGELLKLDNAKEVKDAAGEFKQLMEGRNLWVGEKEWFVTEKDGTLVATVNAAEGTIRNQRGEYLLRRPLGRANPFRLFFEQSANSTLFFAKDKEMTSFECRDLGLTFVKKGEAWESQQHKGYILSSKQGYLDGVNFPGAWQLEKLDDPRVKKLILPAKVISNAHPLDIKEYFTHEALNIEIGYFEYDLIEKNGHYYTEDPSALLYLAYAYQMIGEYKMAMHYLNQLLHQPLDPRILDEMAKMKDTSPEALAFLCKVVLKGLEDKWVFSGDFRKNFAKCFDKFTLYSHLDAETLPLELRLSDEEQKKLLIYLQKDNLGNTLGLGAKAYALSHAKPGPLTQDLFLHDAIYNSIICAPTIPMSASYWGNNTYLAQAPLGIKPGVSQGELYEQFIPLFLRARHCKSEIAFHVSEWDQLKNKERVGAHPFDLDLQTLWNAVKKDANYFPVVQVLYLVRHYPEVFAHIEFQLGNNDKEIGYIFDIARELAKTLKAAENKLEIPETTFPVPNKPPVKVCPFTYPKESTPRKETPCLGLVQAYFTKETKPVFSNAPFALDLKGHSSLSKRIFAKLKGAFENLKKVKVAVFHKKNEELASTLVKEQKAQEEKLTKIKLEIEKLANPVSTARSFEQMAQIRTAEETISLEEVLLSVGTGNPALLKNPLLDQNAYNALHALAIEYMLGASRLDQLKEAFNKIGSGSDQDVAVILNKTRTFNPKAWPELLFYEYSTGFMLRSEPDQAKLLIDMFTQLFQENPDNDQLKRIAFEFQAGGGKTKVISAIIAAKGLSYGKTPVFFSLPSLFDVVRQDLREVLVQVFQKNAAHIDIDLQYQFDVQKMRDLNQSLKQNKACLIFKPETYHAVHLAWQRALKENQILLFWELDQFLKTLKKDCLFLIDESHRNVDSLLQANKAEGTPEPIEEKQREILIRAYQLMVDQPSLRLRENGQAQVLEAEKKRCLDAIAEQLLKDLEVSDPAALAYVKDQKLSYPKSLPASLQPEIAFVRGLYLKILPSNLSKVGEMDYGPSILETDLVEAPRDQKTPTSAKFESADIAATLTCQGAWQRGVEHQSSMRELLLQLQNEAKEDTDLALRFRAWQKNDPIELKEITESDLYNPKFLQMMIERIGKEPEVITRYLRYLALPQVLHFPEKMTSTGADLVSGSFATVQFSATLGEKELYPFGLDDSYSYWPDLEFLADVVQRCCLPHNGQHHYFEPSTPKKLFEDLYKANPENFKTIEGIIDLGYWSKGHQPKSWAEAFCEFAKDLDYAGAIYFDLDERKEKRLYYMDKDKKVTQLPSTNLKRELATLGLTGKRIFKIYGADETTGTDLTLSDHAKMIVSIGENTTLSAAAQAVMRMRSFLKNPIDPQGQTTLWVLPEKIRTLIKASSGTEDVKGLFGWIAENEAKKLKSTILATAQQDIQFLARHFAKEQIAKTPANYKKYKKCFEFPMPRDPVLAYGIPIEEIDTKLFLTAFTNKYLDESQEDLWKLANQIIERASKLVAKTESPLYDFTATARQVGYRVTVEEVKQQSLLQQKTQSGQVKEILDYAKNEDCLKNLDIKSSSNYSPLSDNPFFPKNLYISKNALNLFSGQTIRKPAYTILIHERKGERCAAVVSNDDAHHYLEQLRKDPSCRAALFTPDGNLYQNGSLELYPNSSELVINSDPWFQEVLASVNLTNGIVENIPLLEKWIQAKPEEFRALWNSLKATSTIQDGTAFKTRTIDLIYERLFQQPIPKESKVKVTVNQESSSQNILKIPDPAPQLQLPKQFGNLTNYSM